MSAPEFEPRHEEPRSPLGRAIRIVGMVLWVLSIIGCALLGPGDTREASAVAVLSSSALIVIGWLME